MTTAPDTDVILVLDEGSFVEQGIRDELTAGRGL